MVDQRPSGWIGTMLHDKWRIESRIARGGVATVFRAKHRRGQLAAIKIMHPELARNPEVRSRFLREAYAANKVGHPGVVRIIDDDVTSDGSAYIVMELLEHGELLEEKREKNGGRLSVPEVARICDQVLDVLAAAHEQGIIHRDIKPENIFVLADGTVKVLDFGIAHIKEAAVQTGEPTATGLLLGTPDFMAPEQALGKRGQIDAQTDIYAVGATMFTLLSSEAVHVQETLSHLLQAASRSQARSLSSTRVGREIPREVIAVVDKALALEKHRRWPSARAMQEALRKAVPQDYASTPALQPLARPSAFPPPPTATPRGGTKALSAPPPAPSPPPPADPAKSASLKPSPMQKLQRIPLPSAPPPAMSSSTPRSGLKTPSIPATTPGSGVKLPAPRLPALSSSTGRAAATLSSSSAATLSSRTEENDSGVPSSDRTKELTPPPSAPTAVIEPAPPSTAERTIVRPPRDGTTRRDPWTAEFTAGDMEGPTVATTETPAVLTSRAFSPPDDEEATRAEPGPPVRAPDVALDEPPPEEEDIKRTMRLDRPRGERAFDPSRPFTPTQRGSGETPFASSPIPAMPHAPAPPYRAGIDDPTRAAPMAPIAPPVHAPPVQAPPHVAATPPLHAQSGWIPHQEAPRRPPLEQEKPRAIRIAEIALAALVVITLSIGGCLLLQNR